MEKMIFDSSTLISMSSNCLLGVIRRLKDDFNVEFLIGPAVMSETVIRAVNSKKFRIDGYRILELIKKGYLKVADEKRMTKETDKVLRYANSILVAKNHYVKAIHRGEAEAISIALTLGASVILVDERTTRLLLENPEGLRRHLKNKLHTSVEIREPALNQFRKLAKDIRVLRSTELVALGFENGYFKQYEEKENVLRIENKRRNLLEGLLWGLKLEGCSISEHEIKDYLKRLA